MKVFYTKTCCAIAPLLFLLSAGCRKEQVQVYRVSENQDQPPQQTEAVPATNAPDIGLPPGHPDISSAGDTSGGMPSGVVPSDAQNVPPLTWTTPPGWRQVPPSEMRVASFKVAGPNGKQADVSVIPLSGMAGGDFANVNRWRGQVGLQPATDDQLQNSAENVQVAGQSAQLYDIAGQNPADGQTNRILGAIQHRDGTAWFFKMTGDGDLVEQQKSVFIYFLKSLSFGSGRQAELPSGHPPIGDMNAPVPAGSVSHEGQPNWQVPSGWQEVSGGQFLIAKFMINGDNGATAAVNVSSSAGDGGGLPANVNRWRGQIGLPPESEIATTTFQVNGGQAQLVDMTGTSVQTGHPAELVGVVVTQEDKTWFYKLMGDPNVVAIQKDIFTRFVRSVKY